MALREGSAARVVSDIKDISDRTDTVCRTERPAVLVVGRWATIRQLLYIILSACGFEVLEAEDWPPVKSRPLPSNVELLLIDTDPHLFPHDNLEWLDECVPVDVPALLLTDDDRHAQDRTTRPVITIPKLFTCEMIVSAAQMAGMLRKRPTRRQSSRNS
jgi:hypothetical protein